MKIHHLLCAAALFAAGSEARADVSRPGSVLVFPTQRSGAYLTLLSVTNTSQSTAVRASFQFVNVVQNGNDPLHPLSCGYFWSTEQLTPNDTVSQIVGCTDPTSQDGGFVVVVAKDPATGCNVAHDSLIGSALVLGPGGSLYTVTPQAFEAIAAPGQCTDVDADGRVDLDDLEYEAAPDVLLLDSFLPLADMRLVLMPLLANPHSQVLTVRLDVFNDNEFPLSTTFTFSCWMDISLADLSGVFTEAYLRGTPNDPTELDVDCDGQQDFETGWARIDALSASSPQGTISNPPILGALTGGPGSLESGRILWGEGVNTSGEL